MIELYEIEGGWGCRVEVNGAKTDQPFHPYKPGRVPMTREEAEALGEALENGLPIPFDPPSNSWPEAPPDPEPNEEIEGLKAENEVLKSRLEDIELFIADKISGGGF